MEQSQNQNTPSEPQRIIKSPLRYPGGKARAVSTILGLIPESTKVLVSPFLGGGSIEIACATRGITVFGFDNFFPLVAFWKYLLHDSRALASKVRDFFPLSKEAFYAYQKYHFTDSIESAAVFYILNRASFSGATLSGGMSPGHPRLTESSIKYLSNFRLENFYVDCQDFTSVFREYQSELMYLDPPYMIESALYGKNGNTHKDFDHYSLANLLHNRKNWILSYNDCEQIRSLYAEFRKFSPKWKYGMSTNKDSKELIIVSDDYSDTLWSLNAFTS